MNSTPSIRILALMEAASVTGPAKNLIHFCRWTRTPEAAALGFRLEVSVATICRKPDDGARNDFVRALRAAQIPAHVLEERYRFDRAVVTQLAELVKALDPDVVQTHMVKSHALFRMTGMHRSRKWLAFQHGYTATDIKESLYRQMDRWSLRSADRVVTVCRAFVPRLLSYGVRNEQVRILHNSVGPAIPISDSEKAQLKAELGLKADDAVILTIGRFSKEKGHKDLIEALANLRQLDPHAAWKAVLVGKGPELKNVEAQTARLGLKDRIVFAGFHANMAPFYAIADIYALPSHTEGSPNVVLEAMAARVPIAATRAGGVPEIVADEVTALIVPVRDSRALGLALGRLLKDPALRQRLSAAALARARQEFSPERYMYSLAGIYAEVLALPSHASLRHSPAL